MAGQPLQTLKKGVSAFLDAIRPNDRVGVMAIADSPQLVIDLSSDKGMIRTKVEALEVRGTQTALYSGAYKAIKKLTESNERGMKVLVLIGDGKDESQQDDYHVEDVIEIASSNGIPVFTIGYTKIDRAYLRVLERISDKTGGSYLESSKDDMLDQQYRQTFARLKNVYVLHYLAMEVPGDGLPHRGAVTVKAQGKSASTDFRFTSPAGIPAVVRSTEIPWWYYAVGGGILLLGALTAYLLIRRSHGKKAEAEKRAAEAERRRIADAEIERRRVESLEKSLEETKRKIESQQHHPSTEKPKPKDPTVIERSMRDRTIVLGAGNIPTLRLEIQVGDLGGKRFDIGASGATIGKSDENSIVLPEPTVSGKHARISVVGGRYIIEDLGSTNGTYVNGKRIQSTEIAHGDAFKFGRCEGFFTLY